MKIRKGLACGTTKRGAFWSTHRDDWVATLRRSGGDGIGQSSDEVTHYLDLRHYRDGLVQATICRSAWHQNGGDGKTYTDASEILGCTTIEDVIVALKSITDKYEQPVYSDHREKEVIAALTALGMPLSEPAPDDAEKQVQV